MRAEIAKAESTAFRPLYPQEGDQLFYSQSRVPEQAASASDRLLARPEEFANTARAISAHQTWIDWNKEELTAHDGLIRSDHPLLRRSLERSQSATSLVKLLRDPIGYLWTYGFGWVEPEEIEEPLKLEPLAFGSLLHEILEKAVTQLEAEERGGFCEKHLMTLLPEPFERLRKASARYGLRAVRFLLLPFGKKRSMKPDLWLKMLYGLKKAGCLISVVGPKYPSVVMRDPMPLVTAS